MSAFHALSRIVDGVRVAAVEVGDLQGSLFYVAGAYDEEPMSRLGNVVEIGESSAIRIKGAAGSQRIDCGGPRGRLAAVSLVDRGHRHREAAPTLWGLDLDAAGRFGSERAVQLGRVLAAGREDLHRLELVA